MAQIIHVNECEPFVHKRPQPKTLAQIDPDFVAVHPAHCLVPPCQPCHWKQWSYIEEPFFRSQAVRLITKTLLMVTSPTFVTPTASIGAESHFEEAVDQLAASCYSCSSRPHS